MRRMRPDSRSISYYSLQESRWRRMRSGYDGCDLVATAAIPESLGYDGCDLVATAA